MTNNKIRSIVAKEGGCEVREEQADGTLGAPRFIPTASRSSQVMTNRPALPVRGAGGDVVVEGGAAPQQAVRDLDPEPNLAPKGKLKIPPQPWTKVYDNDNFYVMQSPDVKQRVMHGKTEYGKRVVDSINKAAGGSHNLNKLGDEWPGPAIYLNFHEEHPFCQNWASCQPQPCPLGGPKPRRASDVEGPFEGVIYHRYSNGFYGGDLAGFLEVQGPGGVIVFRRCGNRHDMASLWGAPISDMLNKLVGLPIVQAQLA